MSFRRLPSRFAIIACLALASACGSKNPNQPSNTANYKGTWTGNYTVSGCTQSGGVALANVCGNTPASAPFVMTLAQSDLSVTGSFSLGSVSFPSTGGTIQGDNSLTLQGSSQDAASGSTVAATWHLTNTGSQIGGTISWTLTNDTISGNATITGTITTAVHSG